jgi:hypothetical protein
MGLTTTATSPTLKSAASHHSNGKAFAHVATGTTARTPINPDDLRMGDHIRVRSVDEITAYASAGGSTTNGGDSKAAPPAAPHVAFIGFPYDEGCGRNGGRIGAADAPANVRKLMQRMGTLVNPEYHVDLRTIQMSDVGDIKTGMYIICAFYSKY